MLRLISILLFFGLAAYFDLKKHFVPDIITALMWLWLAFFGNTQLAAFIFSIMFIIALLRKDMFGWADVLGVPVYVAAFKYTGFTYLALLGFAAPIIYSAIVRKKVPCFPFYFGALLLATILHILLN